MKALKKLWSTLDDDRNWAIYVMLAVIILVAVVWLRSSTPIWNPALWPYWIAFALAAVSTVGLILRMEWSRYTCLLLAALMTLHVARGFYQHGFTLNYMGLALTAVFMLQTFWTMPITRMQQLLADPDFIKSVRETSAELERELEGYQCPRIVVLLREPVPLDAGRLAELAQQAYGHTFEIIPGEHEPVDAAFLPEEHPGPFVAGEPPTLLCFSPPCYLSVFPVDDIHPSACTLRRRENGEPAPYGDGSPEAELLDDDGWVPAFGHRAAIEIGLLPTLGNLQPEDPDYAHIAKLVAELIDARCLGLCFPGTDNLIPVSAQVVEALRSDNPAAALQLEDTTTAERSDSNTRDAI